MRTIFALIAVCVLCATAEAGGNRPKLPRAKTPVTRTTGPGYSNLQSVDFGGTNEYINVGDIATDAATRVVWSAWVFQANCVAQEDVFGKWNASGTQEWFIRLDATGGTACRPVIFYSPNGTTTVFFNGAADSIAENVWVHLCASYDGGGAANADRLKVWGNGTEISGSYSGTFGTVMHTGSEPATIGTRNVGLANPTIGLVDEVAIWIGGTPPSCVDIYNARTLVDLPTFSPAPTHCWDFNTATNATVPDSCGAATGTPANMEAGDFSNANVAP